MPKLRDRIVRTRLRKLLAAALLTALILTIPELTSGTDLTASDDALFRRAIAVIDSLDAHIAYQDSLLVIRRDFYEEVIAAKDRRLDSMDEALKLALKRGDRKVWWRLADALAGYGVRAATE